MVTLSSYSIKAKQKYYDFECQAPFGSKLKLESRATSLDISVGSGNVAVSGFHDPVPLGDEDDSDVVSASFSTSSPLR